MTVETPQKIVETPSEISKEIKAKKPRRGTNTKAKSSSGRVKRGRPKKNKTPLTERDPHKMLVSEILQLVSSAKTKKEKVEILQKLKCPALIKVLVINYNPNIVCRLPEGEVPYKPNDVPAGTSAHTSLHLESRNLHFYFKGGRDDIPQLKLETLFIQTLESLHKDEANLLIYAKDKRLQELYRITEAVIKEAYPEFLSNI